MNKQIITKKYQLWVKHTEFGVEEGHEKCVYTGWQLEAQTDSLEEANHWLYAALNINKHISDAMLCTQVFPRVEV